MMMMTSGREHAGRECQSQQPSSAAHGVKGLEAVPGFNGKRCTLGLGQAHTPTPVVIALEADTLPSDQEIVVGIFDERSRHNLVVGGRPTLIRIPELLSVGILELHLEAPLVIITIRQPVERAPPPNLLEAVKTVALRQLDGLTFPLLVFSALLHPAAPP